MLVSILLHMTALALLILLSPAPVNVVVPREEERPRKRILLSPVPTPSRGGGGSHSIAPPTRGRLPRYARQQFTPAMILPAPVEPKLAVEPSVLLAAHTDLSAVPIGLPNGVIGLPSGGSGRRGGIGNGDRGGIGDGQGSGVAGIVAAPVPLFKPEPEYSEPARKARVQGTVVVEGVIDEKGHPLALKIRDGLGFGLDEQAIEAVKRWRFRPATKDGKPLATVGIFYLTFRLL